MKLDHLHFFWSGQDFIYADVLAVRSALAVHNPRRAILWVSVAPRRNPHWQQLRQLERLDIRSATRYRVHCSNVYLLSDYVRYRVLYDYGGLYLDLDTVSLRPFAHLLKRELMAGYEAKGVVNIAVLLARPQCTVLHDLIRSIDGRMSHTPGLQGAFNMIGPKLFTNACRRHAKGVSLLGPSAFYGTPYHEWGRIWLDHPLPPRALTLHYWGKFARLRASLVSPGQRESTMYHRAVASVLGDDW